MIVASVSASYPPFLSPPPCPPSSTRPSSVPPRPAAPIRFAVNAEDARRREEDPRILFPVAPLPSVSPPARALSSALTALLSGPPPVYSPGVVFVDPSLASPPAPRPASPCRLRPPVRGSYATPPLLPCDRHYASVPHSYLGARSYRHAALSLNWASLPPFLGCRTPWPPLPSSRVAILEVLRRFLSLAFCELLCPWVQVEVRTNGGKTGAGSPRDN